MNRDDFIAKVERERPERITSAELATVKPPPWFDRREPGSRARIRLQLGELKYERRQEDEVWQRVDTWTMLWDD